MGFRLNLSVDFMINSFTHLLTLSVVMSE
jgi:hypothetical protein